MRFESSNHFVNISLVDSNDVNLEQKNSNSKLKGIVVYKNVVSGIDLEYDILPTKVKENIIIKNKNSDIDKLSFCIETDAELILNDNKTISAIKNNKKKSRKENLPALT